MAHAIHHGAQVRVPTADHGLDARFTKALADYRLYRATVAELAQLSDRDLCDLGLSRSMIRDIARESVYGA
jgi:uncharacterized protein YjiS (DUF1127 family)